MRKEMADKLEKELADWRAKLEQLRLKAKLGTMELRDKEKELAEQFEPAYSNAMKKLDEWRANAGDEAKAMRTGLEAGWRELRKVYTDTRAKKP